MTALARPTLAELERRAHALLPALGERAGEAETLRRVPAATVDDLHASGLFRIHQPARVGGAELPYHAIVVLSAILGRACGSTAWVYANLASHHWLLAMWPPEAQDDVWDASIDALIASAFVFPAGRARAVDGGYRLRGRWPFCSGVDLCSWTMFGATVERDGEPDELRMFLVPKSEYEVIDTWHVAGLRGTGSNDVAIADTFVPQHRSVAAAQLLGGPTPGSERNPGPLYRLPVAALFSYVVGGPMLGIAQGAVAEYLERTRSKRSTYAGKALAELATTHVRAAGATADVETAALVMERACTRAMDAANAGDTPALEERVAYRRNGAYAAALCTRAVDAVFSASGGGALYDRNPLSRAFRDAHAASAHFALNWEANAALSGRVQLGLPPDAANI